MITTIVINGLLLTLPILVGLAHSGREKTWPTIRADQSPIGHDLQMIYGDRSDVDVLFVGNSALFAGLLTDQIEAALSKHVGHPCRMRSLAIFGTGLDAEYYILRDFLSRHKTSLIVITDPIDRQKSYEPHMYMSRFLRYGDYPDALTGMPAISRFQVYGEFVLGGPRKFLSEVRPDLLGADETTEVGYEESLKQYRYGSSGGFAYQELPFTERSLPYNTYFKASSPVVKFVGKPPGKYSMHYLKEIVKLAHDNSAALSFIHMPHSDETGQDVLPENLNFANDMGPDTAVLGVPFEVLFKGIPQTNYGMYMDRRSHLNLNGARIFTSAIIPQVLSAFDDFVTGPKNIQKGAK